MIYALDSNTIIYLLNNDKSVIAKRDKAVENKARFTIPPIVDYEIRRGLFYKPSPKKEPMYFSLVNNYGIGEMSSNSWFRAASIYAELRRMSITVGDADILIAAFCIENNYTLVTNNTKHFKDIDGLLIENWVTENENLMERGK